MRRIARYIWLVKKLSPESTRSLLRDAALIAAACAALALAVNALRPDGLPLVAAAPYQILVPCPDLKGDAEGLEVADVDLSAAGTILVDARDVDAFASWHVEGAQSLPYDWLDAPPPERVAALIAAGATRVIVYGDGGDPDCGAELAKELAGAGLRGVAYIIGGARVLGAPAAAPATEEAPR